MRVFSITPDAGGVHVYIEADNAEDVALMADSGKAFAMQAAQQQGHHVNAPTNIRGPFHVDKTTNQILNSQEAVVACRDAGNLVYRSQYSFTFAGA